MVGRTLGHYRVLEKLGEGGMGEVYLAEDTTLKRRVALKVLPSSLASSSERLQRFQREAESLAALNHPNIVHVYSVEEDQGTHYLTMELVEGESLDRMITSRGLPLERFFDLAIPLADALSEAHDYGIVHRDLKPNNVMVDRKGRPKILDFGLAKLRLPESSEDLSQLPTEVMTQEGRVLGTYPYMSPEQVEGKSVDHRSDIFSFGTMLYEMATGRRPFEGDSPASLMSAILRDTPSEVDTERAELPHHLGRIINRCIEKNADDRYQRARDLAKDLEQLWHEVQAGAATIRRPAVAPTTTPPWRIRVVIGLLLLLVFAVVLYLTKSWGEAEPPKQQTRITSLAVLPLENLSGDAGEDYYAAGITDGLIADLGRVSALRVISRQSVMRYQNSDKSLPEIAKELGVEALIEGSVLPAGDRVRVTAQLIQASPESQLWAETYERDAKDILALLGEVTRSIAAEVRVAVSPQEKARITSASEVDPEAHRAYLRGRHFMSIQTPDSLERALDEFRLATELDPTFGQAWASLGEYFAHLAIWVLPVSAEEERAEAWARAHAAIKRALEIDQTLGQAHEVLGMLLFCLEWDWPGAEEQYLLAIELEPNSASAHTSYVNFLSAMGRHEEALEEALIAQRIDPFQVGVALGNAHRWAGDFEAAIDQYEKTLEWSPQQFAALLGLCESFIGLGQEEEAVGCWQRVQRILGNDFLADAFDGKNLDEVNRIWLEYALDPDTPS